MLVSLHFTNYSVTSHSTVTNCGVTKCELQIAFKSLAMALYLYFTHETSSCWNMGKKNPSYSGVAYRSHNTRLIHLYNQSAPSFFSKK